MSGIAGPSGPRYNSLIVGLNTLTPTSNAWYEYISPFDGWGILVYAALTGAAAIGPLGLTLGVAFNALVRNDPTLTVIKIPQ